jgi:hypothetical protein
VVKKGSKTLSFSSSGIPGPVSEIATTACSLSTSTLIVKLFCA